MTLQWDAATDNVGVASYTILRDGTAVGQPTTATTFADTTVQPNTPYTYRVTAVDAAGNVGAFTANLAVVTPALPDTQAPSVPTELTGTGGAGRATLKWTASTDNVKVQGYYVYRGTTRVATVTTTTSVITGLQARTTYTFSVRAFDAAGNVSASSTSVPVRPT